MNKISFPHPMEAPHIIGLICPAVSEEMSFENVDDAETTAYPISSTGVLGSGELKNIISRM